MNSVLDAFGYLLDSPRRSNVLTVLQILGEHHLYKEELVVPALLHAAMEDRELELQDLPIFFNSKIVQTARDLSEMDKALVLTTEEAHIIALAEFIEQLRARPYPSLTAVKLTFRWEKEFLAVAPELYRRYQVAVAIAAENRKGRKKWDPVTATHPWRMMTKAEREKEGSCCAIFEVKDTPLYGRALRDVVRRVKRDYRVEAKV